MHWQGYIDDGSALQGTHSVPAHYTSGHAIGIIAVDLVYPKLPGNVVNATTFPFPVLYKKVTFEIEQLFEGSSELEDQIVAAAKELEAEGVRALVGACGYFVHFQEQVANAVDIPVFMSSLCQLPLIQLGLKQSQKIAVFAASGDNITPPVIERVGGNFGKLIVQDVGSLESFAPIRWGKTELDNKKLTQDLAKIAIDLKKDNPDIGAILLECSDLPPYACTIQQATGLPVFDFITLIKWAYAAVVQKPYYGYF